jgi:hypothetical protein
MKRLHLMINPTKSLATLQQGDAMDKKPFFSTVEQSNSRSIQELITSSNMEN